MHEYWACPGCHGRTDTPAAEETQPPSPARLVDVARQIYAYLANRPDAPEAYVRALGAALEAEQRLTVALAGEGEESKP